MRDITTEEYLSNQRWKGTPVLDCDKDELLRIVEWFLKRDQRDEQQRMQRTLMWGPTA